jgi:hypothetical protein
MSFIQKDQKEKEKEKEKFVPLAIPQDWSLVDIVLHLKHPDQFPLPKDLTNVHTAHSLFAFLVDATSGYWKCNDVVMMNRLQSVLYSIRRIMYPYWWSLSGPLESFYRAVIFGDLSKLPTSKEVESHPEGNVWPALFTDHQTRASFFILANCRLLTLVRYPGARLSLDDVTYTCDKCHQEHSESLAENFPIEFDCKKEKKK